LLLIVLSCKAPRGDSGIHRNTPRFPRITPREDPNPVDKYGRALKCDSEVVRPASSSRTIVAVPRTRDLSRSARRPAPDHRLPRRGRRGPPPPPRVERGSAGATPRSPDLLRDHGRGGRSAKDRNAHPAASPAKNRQRMIEPMPRPSRPARSHVALRFRTIGRKSGAAVGGVKASRTRCP
jgi:hypothetical protein